MTWDHKLNMTEVDKVIRRSTGVIKEGGDSCSSERIHPNSIIFYKIEDGVGKLNFITTDTFFINVHKISEFIRL